MKAHPAAAETGNATFRLIWLGSNGLAPLDDADPPDLADAQTQSRVAMQKAIDALRSRFGNAAVQRGRALDNK